MRMHKADEIQESDYPGSQLGSTLWYPKHYHTSAILDASIVVDGELEDDATNNLPILEGALSCP